VISHRFNPKIKGHMVQTQSMTSVNPKIGNPPGLKNFMLYIYLVGKV